MLKKKRKRKESFLFLLKQSGSTVSISVLNQGALGNAWRIFFDGPTGHCYWHLVGGSQGCCYMSFLAQDSPDTKDYPASNVSSVAVARP